MITLLQSRCFVDDGRVISSRKADLNLRKKKCGDVICGSEHSGIDTYGCGIFAGNVINVLAIRRVMITMGGCL